MEAFDRANLTSLQTDVEGALAKVGKRLGVSFEIGNIRFSETQATISIEAATIRNGKSLCKMESDFLRNADLYDMKESDLNREFALGGKQWRVAGCRPRAKKFPIICTNIANGKNYKFSAQRIADALNDE